MIWAGENETLKKSGVFPLGTLSSRAGKREFVLEMSSSGTQILCNCVILCTYVGAFLIQFCVLLSLLCTYVGAIDYSDRDSDGTWGGKAPRLQGVQGVVCAGIAAVQRPDFQGFIFTRPYH